MNAIDAGQLIINKALNLSRYILTKCNKDGYPINGLQLQAILYIAQREFLTKYGEPLFDDNFEAFKFGPAISVVYYEYSHMGAFKIGADYKDYNKILSGMSQDKIALLDSVIVSNMETNPLELLNKINKAWEKVFNNGEGVGDIISKEAMCERS